MSVSHKTKRHTLVLDPLHCSVEARFPTYHAILLGNQPPIMHRRSRTSIDEELKQLDSQIRKLTAREEDLQRVMDDLSRIKDDVASERIGLEERQKELEVQKDPINWLPPELLIQIFLALVELDVEDVRYHPPMVLSHVCAGWRTAVISSPHLWSRIILQGFTGGETTQLYLTRSKDAPLEINYSTLTNSMPTTESCQALDFISMVARHFTRCVDFSFRSNTPKPILYLIPFLDDFLNVFPKLQRLNLSIRTPNPIYFEAPLLLERGEATKGNGSTTTPPPNSSRLRHLIIGQIPPYNFAAASISHLRKLELSYSPRKQQFSRHGYELKLSSLCGFLGLTPLLEELILNNTVPCLDALPIPPTHNVATNTSTSLYLHHVRLEHLKSIEWTYPSTADVLRFLCLLDAPALDKLDLWVEHPPFKRETEWRSMSSSGQEFVQTQEVPCFPSLRDLSIQCNGDESMVCALRKFSLPALEKAAFTNVDTAARGHNGIQEPLLLVFPRLESIFHDPRLPHLTHLTLSHFKISPEAGRGEAVLGYMPLLTSLSLDSCIGVEILLLALQERLVVGSNPAAANRNRLKRGVKLCPTLEALSIRGCQDVTFDCLRKVVLARNGITKDSSTQEGGSDAGSVNVLPNGDNIGSVTREEDEEGCSREGSQGGNDVANILNKVVRKIKPLNLRHTTGLSSTLLSSPTATMVSTLIAMREVLEPADITYVRIAGCKLVTRDQAMSLRDLRVVDVIWVGSA